MEERNQIKYLLSCLTCDEMDRAWDLFYKWGERTMKERGVKPNDWKQWIKDNKQRRRKCDKYFQKQLALKKEELSSKKY